MTGKYDPKALRRDGFELSAMFFLGLWLLFRLADIADVWTPHIAIGIVYYLIPTLIAMLFAFRIWELARNRGYESNEQILAVTAYAYPVAAVGFARAAIDVGIAIFSKRAITRAALPPTITAAIYAVLCIFAYFGYRATLKKYNLEQWAP